MSQILTSKRTTVTRKIFPFNRKTIILLGDKWNILEILSLCKTASSQWFSAEVAINRLPFQCTYSLTPSIKRSTHCSPTQLVKLVNYVCIRVQRNVASDMRRRYEEPPRLVLCVVQSSIELLIKSQKKASTEAASVSGPHRQPGGQMAHSVILFGI